MPGFGTAQVAWAARASGDWPQHAPPNYQLGGICQACRTTQVRDGPGLCLLPSGWFRNLVLVAGDGRNEKQPQHRPHSGSFQPCQSRGEGCNPGPASRRVPCSFRLTRLHPPPSSATNGPAFVKFDRGRAQPLALDGSSSPTLQHPSTCILAMANSVSFPFWLTRLISRTSVLFSGALDDRRQPCRPRAGMRHPRRDEMDGVTLPASSALPFLSARTKPPPSITYHHPPTTLASVPRQAALDYRDACPFQGRLAVHRLVPRIIVPPRMSTVGSETWVTLTV